MISKTLLKLIDQSIVPAIMLLSARLASIFLISYVKDIKFIFDSSGFTFDSKSDYLYINSYSTLAMIASLAVGLLYILLKALLFHETHVTPHLTTKLFHFRLSYLIQNSMDLYSQGVIWMIYLYLITVISGIFMSFGLIYSWIFFVGLILSVLSTVILVFDVESEINIKSNQNNFIEDKTATVSLGYKKIQYE
ncbi:hypothetical protein A2V49_00565 [candidate division WWE3 bacterium RBG_19FT_COMBO_34_6]|uniref:Uncharacterized protein n=1 Tax=candidate division WWE3 bacterium RBG_19FT_COMBO_34_6 TaxID=1802612 RepID=A0A1F4UNP4_UNCKA|nr:MAG: hypothetical protein A2V49_00565 [candidate division WWE3 bacterium RBG_19FT_COMBO_34_6]